jgi:NhaP-type Na+/H+ or K+/H+ antiporter
VAVLASFKELEADKTLFVLVYGEAMINDAVSIILYR